MQDSMFSMEEVASISGGRRPPAPRDYKLPTVFPSLGKVKRISFDLESYDTSLGEKRGPGWRRGAYIVGFGLAIGDKQGGTEFEEYYPLRHKGGPNLDENRVWDWISTELNFFTGEVTGANLLYDFDGVQYKDVYAPLAKFRDVQWAEALLDENAMSYKLDTLSMKYLGIHKVKEVMKQMYGDHFIRRFHETHPGHARGYVLGDIKQPLQVLDCQLKQLRKEKLEDLFFLESRLLPFLIYMRRQGVRVDLQKATDMGWLLAKRRDEAIAEIAKMSGFETDYDNFGKPAVMKAIFDNLKIQYPYLVKTPDGKEEIVGPGDEEKFPGSTARYEAAKSSGKPSFRKLWLDEGLDHDVADLILTANGAEKARGTFVDGYITDNAIGDRVHCEFHPLRKKEDEHTKSKGTITGRFSGANPNLQNIPTRDPFIGPMCRSMFIADEGAQWWSQDYSQIEYRFLVHYAVDYKCTGATIPQAMYLKNPQTDFHDACAEMMYRKEWHEAIAAYDSGRISKDEMKSIHKKLRKPAKNLNFGMVYGMGAPLLAAQLGETNADGSPNERALEIMKEYHGASPYIRELNKICVDEAMKQEFITTILCRRGRFPLWEPRYQEKGVKREMLPYEQAKAKWGDKIKPSMTHKAMNKRLQGSAADLMKLSMVLLWEGGVFDPGNDITCVLTVHDELNGSFVPSARGEASRQEVKRIMETAMPLHIPVYTSGSVGANWAEAH